MFGVWLVGFGRGCFRILVEMLCFGIFVIVGFWSHLKIVVCFACLVAKKMQEEKQWENLLNLGWRSWSFCSRNF